MATISGGRTDPAPVHPLAVAVRRVQSNAPELTLRQFAVLFLLTLPDGPRTVSALAEALKLGHPVTSRAIDRLEASGLACRIPNPDDKRSNWVAATPEGSAEVADWA